VKLEPPSHIVSSSFRVGSGQSGATKSSFPEPSIFSDSAGSATDISDGPTLSDSEPSDSDDQTSTTHSGNLETLEAGHHFNELRDSIVATLLAGFHSQTSGSSGSQGSDSQSSSGRPARGNNNHPNRSSQKRRQADSDDDTASPFDDSQICKKSKSIPQHELLFACVFFKRDPVRYHACGKAGQKRIRDVKQHLRRKHYDPFYCSRCWLTFSSEHHRDEHTRAQDCDLLPEQNRDQLSWEQIMALGKKVNHKLSPSLQWFSVWDIIFPGRPRPASPFIDPELSEQLSSFRNYYSLRGPDIIFAALSERNLINWDLPNEERDLATFGRAILSDSLDRVFETWLENQRLSSTGIAPSTTDSIGETGSRLGEPAETLSIIDTYVDEASSQVPAMSPQADEDLGTFGAWSAGDVNALETQHLFTFPADNYFLDQTGFGGWDANPDYEFG